MEKYLVVLAAFLGVFVGFSDETIWTDPTWNVLENHYIPWTVNTFTEEDYEHKLKLRNKYLSKLSANQTAPDWDEIHDILSHILKLHPTESYEINNRHVLGWHACRGGNKILKYLTKVGWSEEAALKLIQRVYADFIDKYGYVINFTLSRLQKKLKKVKKEKFGKNYEYFCNSILDGKFEEHEDPFKSETELKYPTGPKPPIVKPVPPPKNSRRLKVIQITDIHLDTKYKAGTWADCDHPVCCKDENNSPKALKAGTYGSWRCNTPLKTFDSLLYHIKSRHPDVDYVIWTGDALPHLYTKRVKMEDMSTVSKISKKIHSVLSGVNVYPAMGHVGPLASSWLLPKNSIFNYLDTQWGRWLPSDTKTTIRETGCYTTLIRPGFRIISMNMNFCSKLNRVFMNENTELEWLLTTLKDAEAKKEKVHIIGHIPPSSSICAKSWKTEYHKIVNRYESTITAQFFGHTHADEFEIFLDLNNTKRAVGVAFIGPSVVPYTYRNPSYKVYYVEGDYKGSQRYVLDHETWYLDLEKANKENRAVWKKLYGAKDEYKMASLYPEDMYDFYKKVKNPDGEELKKYFKNYWSNAPERPDFSKSNTDLLCNIRSCDIYGEDEFILDD